MHGHEHDHYAACKHTHKSKVNVYLVSPLLHALQVAAFVLVVNLAFGYLFFALGDDNVVAFLRAGKWIQPLVCSLVGLVPNCASSAVITATYINGGITLGSCAAGLCANAGLGLVVLFKNTKKIKRNIVFALVLYLISVAVGIVVNVVMVAIGL